MPSYTEELAKVFDRQVVKGVLTASSDKDLRRVNIRRILLRGEAVYQFEKLTNKQAFHENVAPEEAAAKTAELMETFKQAELWTEDTQYSFRITKKGKLLSTHHKAAVSAAETTHNQTKHYLLPQNTVIPPLVDLGVLTKDGKIVKSMTDKYRQIERFVEMVEETLRGEPKDKILRIVDFGCGKSYLTFILYYYLTEVRHQQVEMTGLDLKADVIRNCQQIADKYGYDHLRFQIGDIADFSSEEPMDMVISLHACDTATDFALYHAMRWQSRMILSVPCCQHEIGGQLKKDSIPGITDYGILKERTAAIITDGLRAELLKAQGYQVQLLEFIDMEHSPKNILIRAKYTGKPDRQAEQNAEDLIRTLHLTPTLYTLLKEQQ